MRLLFLRVDTPIALLDLLDLLEVVPVGSAGAEAGEAGNVHPHVLMALQRQGGEVDVVRTVRSFQIFPAVVPLQASISTMPGLRPAL